MIKVRPKILVTDDQPANLLVMKKLLAAMDAEVMTAESGNEALALCQEHEFAMMLLDVQMPEMDGFEVAKLLQDVGLAENMPIVFVTAFPDEGVRTLQAYRVGGVDFIQKPVNDEILLSKVRIFLELFNTRKRLEQMVGDLAEARDRAERADRAKSRFLATMSHEIRTPIHGILGFADLLDSTELTSQQSSYVQTITSSGQGLLTIINDILDFSKIEAGHMHLEHIPFNLTQLLRNTLQLFTVPVRNKGLEMVFKTFPDVPELLKGDPNRLRQILYNLLGNALKFTESGRIALFVESIDADEESILLGFSVDDTGIGIPPEALKQILQPFVQADDSTTRKYGGTGLGLSIVSRLVELMGGGPLRIESKVGSGSSFRFEVRLSSCSVGEFMATEVADTLKLEIGRMHHLKILIVESDQVNRQLAVEILRVVGLSNVVLVDNGLDALEKFNQNVFDLVLADCQMPLMDGYSMSRKMRQMEADSGRKRVPIIVLTANAQADQQPRQDLVDLDGYLVKPFTAEQLLKTMYSVWSGQRDTPEKSSGQQSGPLSGVTLITPENRKQVQEVVLQGRRQLQRIQLAVERKNWPFAMEAALVIKEMATQAGVDVVKHKAVRLKMALQREDLVRVQGLIGELTTALQGVEGRIDNLEVNTY